MNQAAKTLGAIAFEKGIKCAPVLDADLMAMFAGREIGNKQTMTDMKSWIAGWTQANIAA